jgi:drug/metabolite transporter (DMT)-like permease
MAFSAKQEELRAAGDVVLLGVLVLGGTVVATMIAGIALVLAGMALTRRRGNNLAAGRAAER